MRVLCNAHIIPIRTLLAQGMRAFRFYCAVVMLSRIFIHRLAGVASVVILLWMAYLATSAILLLLAAVILATGLDGAAARLQRILPGGRRLSLIVVVLVIGAMLGGLGFLVWPRMAGSVASLRGTIAGLSEQVTQSELFINLVGDVGSTGQDEQPQSGEIMSLLDRFTTVATYSFTIVSSLLLVLALTLFLAWSPALYRQGVLSVLPRRMRPRGEEILDSLARALWHWMLGQGIAMLVIGVLTTLGLYLVGMPSALLLGVIAGLLQFIPYVGPFLSAIPGILLGLAESPAMALWVTGVYAGVQVLEGNLITPYVQRIEASLPPVLTLFATVVMGLVFGPLGLIIGTPLALVALVLYRELYAEVLLRETSERPEPARPPGAAR